MTSEPAHRSQPNTASSSRQVGAEYLETVKRRITELPARPSGVTLPAWPKVEGRDERNNEGCYNEKIAGAEKGYLCLDKKNVHTEARKKFLDKLNELDSERPTPNLEKPVVVLGILLKEGEQVTADSLFSFAQITLLHAENMLKGQGATLEVVSISR